MAESTTGSRITCERCMDTSEDVEKQSPKMLAEKACLGLLDELMYGGFVDTSFQSFIFILMALSEKTISKVKLGRLSKYS